MKKTIYHRTLKTILLISGWSMSIWALRAQQYQSSVSLSFGLATPLGSFGSADADLPESGGADIGRSIDVEFKSYINSSKTIGLITMFKNQSNSLSYSYIQDLSANIFDIYHSSWNLNGYMAGAFYNYRQKNRKNYFIQPKMLVGLLSASTPSLSCYLGNELYLTRYRATSKTFAVLPGLDLGWEVGRFRLQVQYDFLFSKPYFNTEWFDWNTYSSDIESFSQKMRTYSLKFSLGYNFGKIK